MSFSTPILYENRPEWKAFPKNGSTTLSMDKMKYGHIKIRY